MVEEVGLAMVGERGGEGGRGGHLRGREVIQGKRGLFYWCDSGAPIECTFARTMIRMRIMMS